MSGNAAYSLRFRLYRFASKLRCATGVHRWLGHRDCGDGVNVQPISGYRHPPGVGAWRVCSWCGARSKARRIGWGPRAFAWGKAER